MVRIASKSLASSSVSRLESGITGLDKLIEGGFVKNSVNLVAGQTGTGKTIFCMQFLLHGLRNGETCVYITLEQKADDILADMSKFGWDQEFKKYIDSGRLILMSYTPTDIKELESVSFQGIKKVRASRFVLDSLSIATMGWKISSMDVGKIRAEIFNFMSMLKNTGVTALLIAEIPEAEEKKLSRFGFEEFLADGIIKMYYLGVGEAVYHNLEVRKMRRTNHAKGTFPIDFSNEGLRVIAEKGKLHF